ncbi:MAG: NADH-quinone oxidoreductase subunit I, partial [Sphingobacteriales bacterium 24-40-4]
EAIYLDGPIVPADYLRKDFIYGKDKLVEEPMKVQQD